MTEWLTDAPDFTVYGFHTGKQVQFRLSDGAEYTGTYHGWGVFRADGRDWTDIVGWRPAGEMPSEAKLPEWPETPPAFIAPSNALESALITETRLKHYEHARAEAAIARLKVALGALQEIRERSKTSDIAKQRRLLAEKAIAQIGELPKEGG